MKTSELKEIYNLMKSKPCADCGNSFPPECMDFDHRDGEKKVCNVSQVLSNQELFWNEIPKCDLICACCHRMRTKRRGVSAETRANLSKSAIGRKHDNSKSQTEEARARRSESLKAYHARKRLAVRPISSIEDLQ